MLGKLKVIGQTVNRIDYKKHKVRVKLERKYKKYKGECNLWE